MKKRIGLMTLSCLMTILSFMVSVPVSAAVDVVETEVKAGAGMVILAMVLVGLLIAVVVIRIMAGKMNTVRKQDSAKGYGQSLVLTEKSDAFLYSRTTSRRVSK